MNSQPGAREKGKDYVGSPAPFKKKKTAPSGWGVTRLPRETEKKIYFAITLAMLAAWLISRLWAD